ncbi:hypothetical protein C9J03_02320 [Photobacterium gaetbulicola]|uniref:Uncharacterized protein n=1 Tax=Photobacterium gaetbulicola Gung47 TaxID=658445 RepID=A0A0C5WWS7_9GAMM|nr:hypothetical protein [Photobacterium gaetbulicola]AJR09484.1 hypothetical protein H744_2c2831 [Photobacterium gaetbulicola Gung47]PSU14278.1 hypothetical protein C9J03_02320 [Photobacterium gaetbulicola]
MKIKKKSIPLPKIESGYHPYVSEIIRRDKKTICRADQLDDNIINNLIQTMNLHVRETDKATYQIISPNLIFNSLFHLPALKSKSLQVSVFSFDSQIEFQNYLVTELLYRPAMEKHDCFGHNVASRHQLCQKLFKVPSKRHIAQVANIHHSTLRIS